MSVVARQRERAYRGDGPSCGFTMLITRIDLRCYPRYTAPSSKNLSQASAWRAYWACGTEIAVSGFLAKMSGAVLTGLRSSLAWKLESEVLRYSYI